MRQCVGCVAPMQTRDLCVAFFVGVGGAVVLKKGEIGVGSGVDADLGNVLRVASAFDWGSCWNDRSGADEEGNRVDGCVDCDGLAAFYALVGPVVVPVCACGQVD